MRITYDTSLNKCFNELDFFLRQSNQVSALTWLWGGEKQTVVVDFHSCREMRLGAQTMKSNGKVRPRTGLEGPDGEKSYNSTPSLTLTLNRGGWLTPRPGHFTPGKETWYSLYRRLGGPPEPVWTGAENLAPTGILSPDCPARSGSLYRMSYPMAYVSKEMTPNGATVYPSDTRTMRMQHQSNHNRWSTAKIFPKKNKKKSGPENPTRTALGANPDLRDQKSAKSYALQLQHMYTCDL
jgi:hypothetical protein